MSLNRQQQTIDGICEREHFVEFYRQEEPFLANLQNFIAAGLQAGSPCLVVATAEHRATIDRQLSQAGFDPDQARSAGTYVSLDAAEALAQFMVGDMPNRKRFQKLVGGILGKFSENPQPIRCFGEMVALLWNEGNHAGAVLLEELWNELARDHSFTLFCAYPAYHFSSKAYAELQQQISDLHSCTIMPAALTEAA